jgi:hypothetical protein
MSFAFKSKITYTFINNSKIPIEFSNHLSNSVSFICMMNEGSSELNLDSVKHLRGDSSTVPISTLNDDMLNFLLAQSCGGTNSSDSCSNNRHLDNNVQNVE